MIPSEKGKGARKPTVNFMQGQLLVRRLHNGLKKNKRMYPVGPAKQKGGLQQRERVKERGGLVKFKNLELN